MEEEQGEEDWTGSRTQQAPEAGDIDLFDDGDGAHASARPPLRSGGDSSQDGQSGPGEGGGRSGPVGGICRFSVAFRSSPGQRRGLFVLTTWAGLG